MIENEIEQVEMIVVVVEETAIGPFDRFQFVIVVIVIVIVVDLNALVAETNATRLDSVADQRWTQLLAVVLVIAIVIDAVGVDVVVDPTIVELDLSSSLGQKNKNKKQSKYDSNKEEIQIF